MIRYMTHATHVVGCSDPTGIWSPNLMSHTYYQVTLHTTDGTLSHRQIIVPTMFGEKGWLVHFRMVEAHTYQVRVQEIRNDGGLGDMQASRIDAMDFVGSYATVEVYFSLSTDPGNEEPWLTSVIARVFNEGNHGHA